MRTTSVSETAGVWRRLSLLLAAVIAAAVLAFDPATGPDEIDGPTRARGDEADPGAGMRVLRDPATGSSTSPPPEALRGRGSGSGVVLGDELIEVPGPSDAGGTMVHLKRRFRAGMTSRREPDGSVKAECRETSSEPTRSE